MSIRYARDRWYTVEEYRETLREDGVEVDVAPLGRSRRARGELLGLRLRELVNILRFSHPDYAGRDALSTRALLKKGVGPQKWGSRIRRLGSRAAFRVGQAAAWVESGLPAPRYALDILDEEQPTAVVAVPVIRAPALVDFLKAAAERAIPSIIWVQSWDNLTNKGLLHFEPDRVFVWNRWQTAELERYHGVRPDRVCTTGAQTFDHWFDGTPVPDREDFCASLGVDPGRPIILYLSSSKQIAPDEPAFFERWLTAVRSSGDETLQSATVLIRPHPTMNGPWYEAGFDSQPGVVMSPATRRDKINSQGFRQQYRAELRHAMIVVGINTSGLIDAAIFGKPACTVELPELFRGQRGTVHFEHLARPDDGLLRVAMSVEEHVTTLGELIHRDTYASDERSTAFVRAFVRPHGLDTSPTQVFVDEMLELCRSASLVEAPSGPVRVAATAAAALANVTELPGRARKLRLRRRIRKQAVAMYRMLRRRGRKLARAMARMMRRLGRRWAHALRRPMRRVVRRAARGPRRFARALARHLAGRTTRTADMPVRVAGHDGPAQDRAPEPERSQHPPSGSRAASSSTTEL